MTHQLGSAICLLALVSIPAEIVAQEPALDQGAFRITRDSAVVGWEEFTIRRGRRTEEGEGYILSATASYPPNRPTTRFASVIEFGPDSQPTNGQIDIDDGEQRSILVAVASRRVTVRTVTRRGESARQYPATDRTMIVDEALMSSYVVLPSPTAGSVAVIEPRDLRRTVADLMDHGLDQTRLNGHTLTLRHLTLGSGSGVRHLWYDEAWRLRKIFVPATGLTAVRTRRSEP